MPMFSEIKATGPGVYYLGHVQAVTRERKPGELSSSGSIFQMPINQLATMPTGYNDSTFDVVISDQSEKDIPTFKSKFPALKNVAIQKMILPPVDKAEIKRISNNLLNSITCLATHSAFGKQTCTLGLGTLLLKALTPCDFGVYFEGAVDFDSVLVF